MKRDRQRDFARSALGCRDVVAAHRQRCEVPAPSRHHAPHPGPCARFDLATARPRVSPPRRAVAASHAHAEQVARFHDMPTEALPAETASAITEYLEALPVGSAQVRKPRAASGRLRPTMRLMELFADWQNGQKPRPQTAVEYQAAALDFIDFLGDIPVAEIERGDLLDFRDQVEKLPTSMPT